MPRALIVDDKSENLYFLNALLTGNGYVVDSAGNGADALALARANPPDLIISDILMPGMDGFALCRQWKQDPALRSIPFVFYTATYTDPKDEEAALRAGADLYMIKPQEPEAFMDQIAGILRQQQAGKLHPSPAPLADETSYLREYNAALVRKLEDKLVQLEHANKVRNALLASVSHELRTPLTPVMLLVDLLLEDPATPPHVREHVETIGDHIQIEKHLISDLLDYAAMHSGRLNLRRQPLSLHPMVQHMVAGWKQQVEAKTLRLDLRLEAACDRVCGDRHRLEQVLWNLMHNAVRRSPENGTVVIHSLQLEGERIALEVQDSGQKIDAETIAWIFSPFEHGVNIGSACAQGMGLGLAVSKGIVEAHGGNISIRTDGQYLQTAVTMELPVDRSGG